MVIYGCQRGQRGIFVVASTFLHLPEANLVQYTNGILACGQPCLSARLRIGDAGLKGFSAAAKRRHSQVAGRDGYSKLFDVGGCNNSCALLRKSCFTIAAQMEQNDGVDENEEKKTVGRIRPRRIPSIPSLLYRPLQFVDVEAIVKGMSPVQRRIAGSVFLGVLAGVAWLRNLGAAGLVDDTEPLFVEAARQMILTGDYITPQFNAQPRFDKPVLVYWLMALSGKVLGPEVWAFRLPSALCAIGLLWGLVATVRHFPLISSPQALTDARDTYSTYYLPAIVSAAAFTLNLEVLAWGSTALSDMLLTSTLAGALITFFWGYTGCTESPRRHQWGYYLSAMFMGLACLGKGPIGLVFPVLVCTCFLLCTGELKTVLREELPWVGGILTFLGVTVPWYVTMASKHGAMYISTFFGYHNFERFLAGVNHHVGRPWWYGLAVVLLMYLPWSLSIQPALFHADPWGNRFRWRDLPRDRRLSMFAATWLVAGFLCFALSSTQLPSYYLPIAPAVALLSASHLSGKTTESCKDLAIGIAPAVVYQLLAGVVWFMPVLLEASGDTQAVTIGALIVEKYLHLVGLIILGTAGTFATRTAEFATVYVPKFEGGSSELSHPLRGHRSLLPLWVLHTLTMLVFIGAFVNPVYKVVDQVRQSPLRELATTATVLQRDSEPLVMVGTRMPSVVYYSKLPTAFFDTSEEALRVLLQEAAPGVTSALIVSEETMEDTPNVTVLGSAGTYYLLRLEFPSKQHQPSEL